MKVLGELGTAALIDQIRKIQPFIIINEIVDLDESTGALSYSGGSKDELYYAKCKEANERGVPIFIRTRTGSIVPMSFSFITDWVVDISYMKGRWIVRFSISGPEEDISDMNVYPIGYNEISADDIKAKFE